MNLFPTKSISLYDINKNIKDFSSVLKNTIKPFSKIYTKDGVKEFLSNLTINIDESKRVTSWLFDEKANQIIEEDLITLYLKIYLDRWSGALSSIEFKNHKNIDTLLKTLDILSGD